MLSLQGPSWSPDGRLIACASGTIEQGDSSMQALAISVEDGSSTPIRLTDLDIRRPVGWLAWQRSGLQSLATDLGVYADQIWLLTFPKGEARRVTTI